MADDNTIVLEGVRIIFRNFRGEKGPYNKEGTRNFGVILPDVAQAMQLQSDEWNVKWLDPLDEDEGENQEKVPWLPVEAAYDKGRPPRIFMITSRGKTELSEATVQTLDGANITNVDMIVRPYTWNVNDRGGVKAYLQTLYVTIEEDELERKYAELPLQ